MPRSHYSSSSASSRSSRSSRSSQSSRSSRSLDKEQIHSTKLAVPANQTALSWLLYFAGGNPGFVKHIRRDEVVHSRHAKPRLHFVKVKASDFESDSYSDVDYDSASERGIRRRASPMPRGGARGASGGGGGDYRPPMRQARRTDSAAEYGGLPSHLATQHRAPGNPGRHGAPGGQGAAPGNVPGQGNRMGSVGNRPGGVPQTGFPQNGVRQGGVPQGGVPQGVVPQGQRAANGTPMPMAGAQRFATGAPGAPGPGGPRGPTPGGMAPPGMRPGAPMPRSPSGQMPRTAGTPGVNPIIVEG